jgi:hypothetical protein
MGAHAHYPEHSAPASGPHPTALVKFALLVAILAAAVWMMGTVLGGELGTAVTGWFQDLTVR